MKKLLLSLLLLLTASTLLASTNNVLFQEQPEFLPFLWQFTVAAWAGVIADTLRHIAQGTWEWPKWKETVLMPLLWSFGGGVVLAAIFYFAPAILPFVGQVIGGEVTLDTQNLIMLGGALGFIIKQIFNVRRANLKAKMS